MHDTDNKWWYYPWHFLKSKRLAILLIALLTLFSAIGMIIPQISINPGDYQGWAVKYRPLAPVVEYLGLNNLFYTWWFALVGVFFFTNLLACTVHQVLQCLIIWRCRLQPMRAEPLAEFDTAADLAAVQEAAVNTFARAGYKIAGNSGAALFMEKHRWGIWGTVLFHIGLMAIVFGSLLSGAVKTTGYMMVAEGETRREVHDNYAVIYEGPFFAEESHYGFELTLKKQNKIYYENGRLNYMESDFIISENGRLVLEQSLSRGEPLLYKDIRLFEYDDGFAPLVTLKKPDGSVGWQTYLLLSTHRYPTYRTYYHNNLQLPETPYTMTLEFYPDGTIKDKKSFNKSSRLRDPAAKIKIREQERLIAEKVIRQNEALEFDGYRLSFSEIRAWTGLEIVRDPGAGVLFGGFWLALAGLTVLYFWRYQKLQLNLINDGGLTQVKIYYYTVRYRKILADDTRDVVGDLMQKFAKKE